MFPHPLDWDNPTSPKAHPTEKPVNLMTSYILNSSLPGEIVLDLFMGAGSTWVAAIETGREFIGIEMDATYCGIASERMGRAPILSGGVTQKDCPDDLAGLDDLLDTTPEVDELLAM